MANPDDLQSDPLLQSAPSCEGFKVLEPAVLYSRIGAGGMGAVYRGRHFSLECDVAVKVLKPDLAHDDQFVARFAREAKLAARISNDNVVRVLDVKEKNGIHYLVMEFVQGETARGRVKRKGPLKESEALAIVLGAALGLRDAHTQGIVHRDIKPDNVLVSAQGSIKLADLGLAKQKQSPGDQNLTVLSSGVMGTPQYMPPEQWRTPDVTPAADVWALGATLYYLLAGKSGIPAGEMLVIAEFIRDHDFPDVTAVRPDVRPEVAALIAKCTARKPEQRFADARELLKALRPLVAMDDELLRDPEAGAVNSNIAVVTPPPRATLARIKVQIEADADEVPTRPAGGEATMATVRSPGGAATQPASGPGRTVAGAAATAAGGGAPSAPPASQPASQPVPAARRALPWIAAALLVAAGAGGAYQAGWFGTKPGAPPGTSPGTSPGKPTSPVAGVASPQVANDKPQVPSTGDPAQDAKNALARGLEELPRAAGLDAAIAQFETALQLDPTLAEAKQNLVRAQVQKSRQLVGSDPDGAYDAAARAAQLAGDEQPAKDALAAATAAVQQRLAKGIAVRTPAANAVVGDATFRVEGTVGVPNVRSVRVAVDPRDAANQPFARDAAAAQVVGGVFEASVRARGEGPQLVRVLGEDARGPVAEIAAHPVVVDTVAPELRIERPAADAFVGAMVEVVARATDATAVVVDVAGVRATQATDGSFAARVAVADGAQEIAVVATDAGGHTSRRTVRVRADAKPPALELAEPLPKATNKPELRVRGTVRDDNPVTLALGERNVAVGADGSFEVVFTFPAEGEHELRLVAKDAAGNEAPLAARVRYDATPPVLAWTEPKADAAPAGDVALSGTVADASACEVMVDGAAATMDGERWRARVRLDAETPRTVKVTARDAAGNDAKPLERTLRGESPLAALTWATPAAEARAVRVGDRVLPSLVTDNSTGIRLVLVPAGEFTMGSPAGEPERDDEETAHRVTITRAFWLGETEITQEQWQRAMGNNPSQHRGEQNPVDSVSWDDCQKLVAKINTVGGARWRLPSEAEWEYACRAGTTTPFSFGAIIDSSQVNFDGSRPYTGGAASEYRRAVLPVRSLAANAFGLFDMHGNVFEWCEDTWAPYGGAGTDAPVRGDGKPVVRGGAWGSMARGCRSAARFHGFERYTKNDRVGVRLARSLDD